MVFFTGIYQLNAQVEILLTENSGCDSLLIDASLAPEDVYDTITSLTWSIEENGLNASGDKAGFLLKEPGEYSLTVQINNDYSLEYPSKLIVYSSPDADFTFSDTGSVKGYKREFRPLENSGELLNCTFEWYIGEKFIANTPEISYNFAEKGHHPVRLTVTNEDGCSSSSSRMVIVAELLECPNVFTPNMDGYNDFFNVETDGNTVYSFQVFSRTGLKVYHTESPYISWDGRSLSGVEMQPGIYYYLIETVNSDENEKISGFVHLIK